MNIPHIALIVFKSLTLFQDKPEAETGGRWHHPAEET
jgi:hypothetical protein